MRTIKFRGKRVDNGEWIYGDLLQWQTKGISAIVPQNGNEWSNPYDFEVIPESVGQFTGLIDGNGVEMYDGDEFRTVWKSEENTIHEGVVFWNVARGRWDAKNATFTSRSRKTTMVTGNIHETPNP